MIPTESYRDPGLLVVQKETQNYQEHLSKVQEAEKTMSGEAAIASGSGDTRFRQSKKPVQEDRPPGQEQ